MIYIDALVDYSALTHRPSPDLWCHMVTDADLDELHAFAAQLGMQRSRFQDKPGHPHYDLQPPQRAQAVELGALEVGPDELLDALRRCVGDF